MAQNPKHKGIREWSSEELSSVALGQNGFHVITNGDAAIGATETITGPDGSAEHTGKDAGTYWIAIKAVHADAVVSARSYGAGDDLSQSGAYASGGQITIAHGDIIYGAFDAITVDSGDYVLAYIGKV
tara:strand:- start:4775 stop:5158 length:384 start_codon:yes stop_codon:yes gene_type:complete